MEQSKKLKKAIPIPEGVENETAFNHPRSQTALIAYPASLKRLDLLCYTSFFAQIKLSDYYDRVRRLFNKFVKTTLESSDFPLKFILLDLDSVHVCVITDASFSTTIESKSQLGIIILPRDRTGACNLVHASSVKAKRRARSVLSAEMFALLNGFDSGFVVRKRCNRMMGGDVELHILTDSRSAFHIANTLVQTQGKRLTLDIHLLREAYEKREITKISWISAEYNLADFLTKMRNNDSLTKLLGTNHFEVKTTGWIDRNLTPVHAGNRPSLDESLETFARCKKRLIECSDGQRM